MGGSNCCIVGCPASRSRNRGLGFFKLPDAKKHPEWRSRFLQIIKAMREDKVNVERLTVCSRHFSPECIIENNINTDKRKRYALHVGSIPTLFLPEKSIPTKQKTPRKPPVIRIPPSSTSSSTLYSSSFTDLSDNIKVPSGWIYEINPNNIILYKFKNGTSLKVVVDTALVCRMFYNDYMIPDTVIIQSDLYSYLYKFENSDFCLGILDTNLQSYSDIDQTKYKNHFLHVKLNMDSPQIIDYQTAIRSTSCTGFSSLSNVKSICKNCYYVKTNLKRKFRRDMCTSETKIISSKTALQRVSKGVLTKALKESRRRIKMLKKQVVQIQTKIRKDSVLVKNSNLHDSLIEVIENEELCDPLVRLFWEQQKLAFSKGAGGHKWHPMLIRLAILLHSQSAASYRSLRDTGIIKLPGESTLRDYTNVIKPAHGFQNEVLSELKEISNKLEDNHRWVVMLHDEMSVKSDLVFDRQNGDVVGFINNECVKKESTLKNNIASHCLVFMVIGVNSNIKCSLGWFPTKCATASDLYPKFWEGVGHLETFCNLKVIGATSDKASSNLRFINIHGTDSYKTTNVFAPSRNIYFFSDVPHLLKTVRNNLAASGSNQNTRYLWKNGRHLLWKHVKEVFEKDMCNELSRCTKLSYSHIHLTSYSVMKVKYAVQVLSKSVGKIMESYGGDDVQETAKFILLMDRFFDCLNVRSLYEADCKRKPDLLPYKDIDDSRFKFLTEEFLGYLEEWKKEIDERPGFSLSEKSKMFLSHQTYKGLVMTTKSFVEAAKFLLVNGVSFVLSNKFCQDPIEEHFGRHRAIGRRSDNPTVYQFGYQENKLRLQRSIALLIRPKGNVLNKRKIPVQIEETPLKKRKKKLG